MWKQDTIKLTKIRIVKIRKRFIYVFINGTKAKACFVFIFLKKKMIKIRSTANFERFDRHCTARIDTSSRFVRCLIADGKYDHVTCARQLMYHCEARVTGLSATVYGRAMYPEATIRSTIREARAWNAIRCVVTQSNFGARLDLLYYIIRITRNKRELSI